MLFSTDTKDVGDYYLTEPTYLFLNKSSYTITTEGFIDVTKTVGKSLKKWFTDFVRWLRAKIAQFSKWLRRKPTATLNDAKKEKGKTSFNVKEPFYWD